MPIFEYACAECGHHFEAIVLGSQAPHCPQCDGERLDKQLSVFAVGAGGGSPSSARAAVGPCGSCGDPRGPGSCSIN
jgi:putative FmdB family regulatory protein